MRLFFDLCPDAARRETRTVIAFGQASLPDDEYAFLESYCDEPDCDCRRSMIQVMSKRHGIVATLGYGWEGPEFYEKWYGSSEIIEDLVGVTLAPMTIQSQYSDALRELFEHTLLNDSDYARRFPRHYEEFRAAVRAQNAVAASRMRPSNRKRRLRLNPRRKL